MVSQKIKKKNLNLLSPFHDAQLIRLYCSPTNSQNLNNLGTARKEFTQIEIYYTLKKVYKYPA